MRVSPQFVGHDEPRECDFLAYFTKMRNEDGRRHVTLVSYASALNNTLRMKTGYEISNFPSVVEFLKGEGLASIVESCKYNITSILNALWVNVMLNFFEN